MSSPAKPVGWLGRPAEARWPSGDETDPNPFVRFRHLLWSHRHAIETGMDDRGFVDLVHRLDDSVASVDGGGFRHTPLLHLGDLGTAMGHTGGLSGKDETGNVSGSHKARHLFGLALHLAVDGVPTDTPLAIASCGNAALGAAVVARATGRPLAVHVPTWADPEILDRLADLGADVRVCERRKGGTGDPCVLRFRELVTDGAIPFGCQGTENLMTIDGGRTLGFELASDLADRGAAADHLLIQVGGGALASSTVQALTDAVDLGVLDVRPALHAVQVEGCAPLARAFDMASRSDDPLDAVVDGEPGRYMWPWEEPASLATGILDDVVYDWQPIVWAMLDDRSGPIVATEAEIAEAHRLVHAHTQVDADPTGTAGVAGLLAARRDGLIGPDETVVVLLTGAERRH